MPYACGEVVNLRYRYVDGAVQAVLPMYTVADDGETLVGWTPPGTAIMYWALADGRDPREFPLPERFAAGLTTAPRTWRGAGVLRVIPRSSLYQVVHFWGQDGFRGWYVNLESDKTDRGAFIDAVDWHLDLWIPADGSPQWKDVEEADAAVAAGHLTPGQLGQARRTGNAVLDHLDTWPAPIGDWTDFTSPQGWLALPLPSDWDTDGTRR